MRIKDSYILIFSVLLILATFSKLGMAETFYEGKTIKLIVATKPGGGYDFYGRLIGKFMQDNLPGSTVVIENVPGAGHIIGTNKIYHSESDGLTFGIFNRAIPLTQVAELKGVKFDLAKMSWLGSATSELYCLVVTKRFKTLDDIMKSDKVTLAAGGSGNLSLLAASLFQHIASMSNLNIVKGYLGNEGELAMMRGEVDGQFASFASLDQFIKNGHGHPVLFIGKKQPEGYENIPLLTEVVKEANYQPVIDLLLAVNSLGRPFAGPPGIPEDRLKILRDAFQKACKNQALIKLASNSGKSIDCISGDEAQNQVSNLMRQPAEISYLIKRSYGVVSN